MNLIGLILICCIFIGGLVLIFKALAAERKNATEIARFYEEIQSQATAKNILFGPYIALDMRGLGIHKANRLLILYADKTNLHLVYAKASSSGTEEGLAVPINKLSIKSTNGPGLSNHGLLEIELSSQFLGFYYLHSLTNNAKALKSSTFLYVGKESKQQIEKLKSFLLAHGAQEK